MLDFIHCGRICSIHISDQGDAASKTQWYKYLLGDLPQVNFHTLKALITHLARVAENESQNRMGVLNLASIFGPVLLDTEKVRRSLVWGGCRSRKMIMKILLVFFFVVVFGEE